MKITQTNIVLMSTIITVYLVMDIALSNGSPTGILLFIILQAATILFVMSPVAEAILRFLFGCRRIMTEHEQQKLLPLYEEVYNSYINSYPKARKDIELFIDNTMDINAYAMGRKTIVITKGAMQLLNDEQIKGLLAHEFAHHCHGDTLIFPLLVVGNIVMMFIMVIIKVCELIMTFANYMMGNQSRHKILASVISLLFRGVYALITFLISCFILVNQRGSEYLADEFALKIGYGESLKNALYLLLQVGESGGKITLIEKVKSSHPDTHMRIARLEQGLASVSLTAY